MNNARHMLSLLFFVFLFPSVFCFAQQEYLVFFKDKGNNKNALAAEKSLSEKTFKRRALQGIKTDYYDLPVNDFYVAQMKEAGCKILSSSKWLNVVHITAFHSSFELLQLFKFIEKIIVLSEQKSFLPEEKFNTPENSVSSPASSKNEYKSTDVIDYGQAYLQNTMLGILCLHNKGYTGKDVVIAVLDGGFAGADTMYAFDSLRLQGRITGTYDFALNDTFPYRTDQHGSGVLSVMAANIPGEMVGIAPHAKYMLARVLSSNLYDTHADEYKWIRAMEWADSAGADIISTSLGFSNYYGGGDTNYVYADMDGNTAIVTIGADIAARKGLLVVASAGNQGDKPWKRIGAPCDGDSVLCVGAVNSSGVYCSFSSYGPSADGRVKPDVTAMGQYTKGLYPGTGIISMNGTSFSTPLVAGLAACLKQKYPSAENMELINAIIKSANRFNNPDTAYGYGVPDGCKADLMLTDVLKKNDSDTSFAFNIFPNPVQNNFTLHLQSPVPTDMYNISISNVLGQTFGNIKYKKVQNEYLFDLSHLPSGMYFIKIQIREKIFLKKIIKYAD